MLLLQNVLVYNTMKANSRRWGNTDQILRFFDGGFGVTVAKLQSWREAFTF